MSQTPTRESGSQHYLPDERGEMLAFVPSDAVDFVELGCGAGDFAALLKCTIPQAKIIGVEVHPDAAREARKKMESVIEAPVEIALDEFAPSSVDCVICNDILEHLVDPWSVLRHVRSILRPTGCIVGSIPNVRHFPVFKNYFLGGDWEYEKWGVLDRTHLRFFTQKSLRRLFVETGFNVTQLIGIRPMRLPWKAAALNLMLRGRLDDMRYQRFGCVAIIDRAVPDV